MSAKQPNGAIVLTGDLRHFLSECIVQVKNGELDTVRASAITKMAGQINASFAAETETLRLQKLLDRQVSELGQVPLRHK